MSFLPKSLVWRTTFVLLAGLLVSNLVGLLIYTQERNMALHNVAGEDIAERIAAVTRTVSNLPTADRPAVACSQSGTGFAVLLTKEALVQANDGATATDQVVAILDDLMGGPKPEQRRIAAFSDAEERLALSAFTDTLRRCTTPLAEMRGMGNMPDMAMSMGMVRLMQGWSNTGILRASLQLEDGEWLNFLTTTPEIRQIWNPRFVLAFVVMSIIVTALSVWAVRRSVAPLDVFAKASERLGRDMNAPSLREDGPPEMGRAAKAFNDMQTRLRRLINDRTQMLAAVSHDLRTPVTRLRLRAEFVEDNEQREKMLSDLAQMEAMISATLSFARLDSSEERRKSLDLAGLVQSVCDDAAELGRDVSYKGPDRISFHGRPVALRRVFDNLLDNAIKYGAAAEVTMSATPAQVTVTICDSGPGIPEDQLEQVFEPFQRLETSRSRETGGVGLGLAVVRSIIRGHGGEVTLTNRPKGGLCAEIIFPVIEND